MQQYQVNDHQPLFSNSSVVKLPINSISDSTTRISGFSLSKRTVEAVRVAFHNHANHSPSGDMWKAIEAMSDTMEDMVEGRAKKAFYLSSLDPGVGKTTTLVQFLRVLMASPTHSQSSALICVSRIAEIRKMVEECDLNASEFAVFTSDESLNALGGRLRGDARVLFTTHQMVQKRLNGRPFVTTEEFHYRGRPRPLRVWDEAILPGEALTLDKDSLAALFRPLRPTLPELTERLEALHYQLSVAEDRGTIDVPNLSDAFGIDLNDLMRTLQDAPAVDQRAATTLWQLGGKTATVRHDGQGRRTMLDYRDLLPEDLAPLLVLDASGRVRNTYDGWETGRGNLIRLPAAPKSYRNLCIHVWNHAGGKSAFARDGKSLISGIASTVNSEPDEPFLIVHHKSTIDMNLPERLLDHVEGDRSRLSFIHWGDHAATNEFASIPNVILAGTLFYRPSLYEAVGRLSYATPSGTPFPQPTLDQIRLGEHSDVILQASCRGAIRACVGDSCPPTNLYIIASMRSGIRNALPRIFPDSRIIDWRPVETVLRGRAKEALNHIEKQLQERPGEIVSFSEVRQALRMTSAANFRNDIRRHERFVAALAERGIVEWGTGSRMTGFRKAIDLCEFDEVSETSTQ